MFTGKTLQLTPAGGGVVLMTLGRRDGVNRLDAQFIKDLGAAVSELEDSRSAKGLVIASSQPDFMTGSTLADIYAAMGTNAEGEGGARKIYRLQIEASARLFLRIEKLKVPTACVLSGRVVATGASLALACERRIGVKGAVIGWPEPRIGISPAQGALIRLPRLLGIETAARMLTSGQTIDMESAVRTGLVEEEGDSFDTAMDAAIARLGSGGARPSVTQPETDHWGILRRVEDDIALIASHLFPAQRQILRALGAQHNKPFLQALAAESDLHCRLANSTSARDLISVSLAEMAVRNRSSEMSRGNGPTPSAPLLVIDDASDLELVAKLVAAYPGSRIISQSSQAKPLRAKVEQAAARSIHDDHWLSESAGGANVDVALLLIGSNTDVAVNWWMDRIVAMTPPDCPIICALARARLETYQLPRLGPRSIAGVRYITGAAGQPVMEIVYGPTSGEDSVSCAARIANDLGALSLLIKDIESGPSVLLMKTVSDTCEALAHPSLPLVLIQYALTLAGFPPGLLEHCKRSVASLDGVAYEAPGPGSPPIGLRTLSDSDVIAVVAAALTATAQHLRRTEAVASAYELDALSIRALGFPSALGGICQFSDAQESSMEVGRRGLAEHLPPGLAQSISTVGRPFYPGRTRGLIVPEATARS